MDRRRLQQLAAVVSAGALVVALTPGAVFAASAASPADRTGAEGAKGAAAAPSLTVTPHTDLRDGQIVALRAAGFSAKATIGIAECKAGGPAVVSDCDISTSLLTTSSAKGTVALSYQVSRYITVGAKTIDCAVHDSCVLGVGRYPATSTQHAEVVLAFNPKLPPVLPTVAISPSSALVPNQPVTVTGSGYRPNSSVQVVECPTSGKPDFERCQGYFTNSEQALTSATGTIDTTFRPSDRVLESGRTGVSKASCAAVSGCSLVVQTGRIGAEPYVPLGFAPGATPVEPTVSVHPRRGLADGQFVTVTGSGFAPDAGVEITECAPSDVAQFTCSSDDYLIVDASASGEVTSAFPVVETITAGSKTTDCATTHCYVFVAESSDTWYSASWVLSFDPALAAVRPTIAAAPSTGLMNDQVITLTGGGFTPGTGVSVLECSGPASQCQPGFVPTGLTTADTSGGFVAGFVVGDLATDDFSCTTTTPCRIEAVDQQDPQQAASVQISFSSP